MENLEHLTHLIDLNLRENNLNETNNYSWCLKKSNLSGRGLFANRDINVGETIFIDRPLIIGPIARKDTILNVCTICYQLLDENDCLCDKGCSLPVCKNCSKCDMHARECELYRKWKPIEPNVINQNSLRLITIARALSLNDEKKELFYEMQANFDPGYKQEIRKASKCFYEFPDDDYTLDYLYRCIAVLNTNAFETLCQRESPHEILLRGLYPLAALMNHECIPNTSHEFNENNNMIMKACKFIPKGTEITTTYTKLLWNNMSRRIFLTITKGFTCNCLRCCDPTEIGTYLSAIYCRKNNCFGLIIANDCLEKIWTCMKCNEIYDSNHVAKIQNFSLNAINSKITSGSVKELINFIKERVPKICPETNQLALEAKLSVIWRMNKSTEEYTEQDYFEKIRYCEDVINILNKLDAGECTLKKLLLKEIENVRLHI